MFLFVVSKQNLANLLIQSFSLEKIKNNPSFSIWGNENYQLVLSGRGNIACALATQGLILENKEKKISGILFIGFAKHKKLKEFTSILAHKISDNDNKDFFIPEILFDCPCYCQEVISSDSIDEENMKEDYCYEKEALGYCLSSEKFLPSKFIQTLLIISKNAYSNEIKEEELTNNLDIIKYLTEKLSSTTTCDRKLNNPIDRFCYTVSQKHSIKNIVTEIDKLNLKPKKKNKHLAPFLN